MLPEIKDNTTELSGTEQPTRKLETACIRNLMMSNQVMDMMGVEKIDLILLPL